jgi:hypothetical protein
MTEPRTLPKSPEELLPALPRILHWMRREVTYPGEYNREWREENAALVKLIVDNEGKWVNAPMPRLAVPAVFDPQNQKLSHPERVKLYNRQFEAIGRGKLACAYCKSTNGGGTWFRECFGRETGDRALLEYDCPCWIIRTYVRERLQHIPPIFRDFKLPDLQPYKGSKVPEHQQKKNIAFLQKNSTLSYLFQGPPNSSKTVYQMCLVDKALFEFAMWRYERREQRRMKGVWVLDTSTYLSHVQASANGKLVPKVLESGETIMVDAPPPPILLQHLKDNLEAGWKPRVFLLEVDKVGILTETRKKDLFHLLNMIHEHKGQVVADTNFREGQLKTWFSGGDDLSVDVEVYTRRFLQADGLGQHWDMFKGKFPGPNPETVKVEVNQGYESEDSAPVGVQPSVTSRPAVTRHNPVKGTR